MCLSIKSSCVTEKALMWKLGRWKAARLCMKKTLIIITENNVWFCWQLMLFNAFPVFCANLEFDVSLLESRDWSSWMRGSSCSSFSNTTASAGPPRTNWTWVIYLLKKKIKKCSGIIPDYCGASRVLYICCVFRPCYSFMFPRGTAAVLINENGSRCVSSGLAQLAFWVGSSSTVGVCLTRAWTPKSTAGGSVKGDISKEEVWLLRRALAWGLFYCEKPAASAERDATSALGNPGDDTSGVCEDVLSQLPWHWFTARKSHEGCSMNWSTRHVFVIQNAVLNLDQNRRLCVEFQCDLSLSNFYHDLYF